MLVPDAHAHRLLALIRTAGAALALSGALVASAQSPAPVPAGTPGGAQPDAPSSPPTPAPAAQETALSPFENRVIREVRLEGIAPADEGIVRNQLRSQQGRPLSIEAVRGDIQRFTRLGRFSEINARVVPFDDATVALVFSFVETPVIRDVQVVGNRQISDSDLRGEVAVLAGTPVDRFQLDRTRRRIEDLYRKKGYYQAAVTIDEKELTENGIVLFRIREGDRLKVTDIRFDGNASFPERLLRSQIKTDTAGLFVAGTLDDTQLDQDVAEIIKFYRDRGHLDVRADRSIRPAPNGREAIVTFLVEEGPLYTLRSVRITAADREAPGPGAGGKEKPLTIFTRDQIAALLPIKPGDVYSIDKVGKAVEAIQKAYGQMGYVDAAVGRQELRDPASPQVDLLLTITEGQQFKTGLVTIRGNELTQDKVVRRSIQVKPDRPLDTTAIEDTEELLSFSNLFAGPRERRPGPRVTIQPADPENPGYRDVLVEIEEKNTGSLSFGAALSSDAGVIGSIVLQQRNFDIADVPDSFSEFITGRAFRGAGQNFALSVAPGTEASSYTASFAEPALLDTEYGFSSSIYFTQREFRDYDDDRAGGTIALGRQFGQRWYGEVFARAQQINIRNIDAGASTDVFAVQGDNFLTGLGAKFTRSTVDNRIRPSKGTRLEMGIERVGAAGGDFDFTKFSAEHVLFLTVGEDYLNRKTILSFKTNVNYIPEGRDDAPIFERYFLGGRSLRGYRFRGVSPRGEIFDPLLGPPATIPSNAPVGGTWSFAFNTELEQPLFEKVISVVAFIDTGTVTNDIGFEDYRVAVGLGLRLNLPQLSSAPLAFDFGFPIMKQDGDEERVFSFSVDLPF